MRPKARKHWGDTLTLVSKYLLSGKVPGGFSDRDYANANVAWNENSLDLSHRAKLLTLGFCSDSSSGEFALQISIRAVSSESSTTRGARILSHSLAVPDC